MKQALDPNSIKSVWVSKIATPIEANPVKLRAALDAARAKLAAMNRPPRVYTTEQPRDDRHES